MTIDPRTIEKINESFAKVGEAAKKMVTALDNAMAKAVQQVKDNQEKPK